MRDNQNSPTALLSSTPIVGQVFHHGGMLAPLRPLITSGSAAGSGTGDVASKS